MESKATKFLVWYCGEKLGVFPSLEEAQKNITDHPNYKKSYFNKKGHATSKNPNQKEYFTITDNMGDCWYIK